jgi:hypothetical protein
MAQPALVELGFVEQQAVLFDSSQLEEMSQKRRNPTHVTSHEMVANGDGLEYAHSSLNRACGLLDALALITRRE